MFSILVLFVILLFQKKTSLIIPKKRKDWLSSALLGLTNPFLYYVVLFKSYTLLKAQEAGTFKLFLAYNAGYTIYSIT